MGHKYKGYQRNFHNFRPGGENKNTVQKDNRKISSESQKHCNP